MRTNNLKTKILFILTAVILGVASVVTLYNIVHDKRQNELRIEDAYQSVSLHYEETIKDIVDFYIARTHANINTLGVLEVVRSRDHDKLYTLISPRWEVMRKENPALSVMQFHNADGTSLLRMHRPNVYGDNIASQRAMVAHIHKYHKTVYGFEEGREGLAFRILVPIIDHGIYLGALEFGIEASYITNKIERYTGYQSFFLVDEKKVGKLSHIDSYMHIDNFLAVDVSPKLLSLVKKYRDSHLSGENGVIRYGNNAYVMKSITVGDYENKPVGGIVFIREIPDFWTHIFQMIMATGLIALVLIFVLGGLISRLYNSIAIKMSFQEMYNQTVLDAIPSMVIVTDGHQLIAANQTFLAYFHYDSIESFKHDHACVCEYFEEGDTDEYLLPMVNDQRWTEYINDNPLSHHKAKITMDGETTVYDVKLSLLRFKAQSRYVVMFTDISSMQSISMSDPLTGIANRLHFTMVYEHAINVARRDKNPLGIIFFDIDYFKKVNDVYGHLAGDKILKEMAVLVKQRLRKSDIFARWGGEEFIILLPDTSLAETLKVAEILRDVIERENFDTVGQMTCSFGVAVLNENDSAEILLKRADECLYKAKADGRNRVIY